MWKRSICDVGFFAWKRSFMIFAHNRLAARNLAISSKKLLWAAKKKDSLPANLSRSNPLSVAA